MDGHHGVHLSAVAGDRQAKATKEYALFLEIYFSLRARRVLRGEAI
jgi:hypothetical protein